MLHEGDALPLHRLCDERLGRVAAGPEAREGGAQCRMVVPVNRLDVPAERTELRLEVAERDDFLGRLVGLDLVAVDDDPEPAEPLVRGGLERLPVLSFLELPVARHHDDQPLPAEPTLRERDPTALGDAHAERAGARLDPRHSDVRVPVEPAQAAEAKQALARDDAEREERGIQARHVVALGREEDVAVGIVESALDDVQLVEQELRDDVERAERRAEVTGAGALHRDERVQPAGIGKERQLRVGVDVGGAYAVELSLRDEAQVRHLRPETVADVGTRLQGERRPNTPAVASSTKAGTTGTEYSATAYTASDVDTITASAAAASTIGTAIRLGRRQSTAAIPTRSHMNGRG